MNKQLWALIFLVVGTLCFLAIFGLSYSMTHPEKLKSAEQSFIEACERSTKYVGGGITSNGVPNTTSKPWSCVWPVNTDGR